MLTTLVSCLLALSGGWLVGRQSLRLENRRLRALLVALRRRA